MAGESGFAAVFGAADDWNRRGRCDRARWNGIRCLQPIYGYMNGGWRSLHYYRMSEDETRNLICLNLGCGYFEFVEGNQARFGWGEEERFCYRLGSLRLGFMGLRLRAPVKPFQTFSLLSYSLSTMSPYFLHYFILFNCKFIFLLTIMNLIHLSPTILFSTTYYPI